MLARWAGLNASHSVFVLRGFPMLQQRRRLLALPLSVCYLLVLLGNFLLLLAVFSRPRLRAPMYVLIATLCAIDVLAATAVAPSTLLALLFDLDHISLCGCLAQMFFSHFLSSLESTLLLAMALDRYLAVCQPLRYAAWVGGAAPAALLVLALLRNGGVMAALVALASSLTFCSHLIQHCYCDHMALVRLACGGARASHAGGVAVIACVVGVDVPLILFSYANILRAASRAAAGGEERRKAFHTCGTHLMVMASFYLVGSVTFLSHNLNIPLPPDANTLMGVTYILLPATVNPIIYGVRTAEIRRRILKIYRRVQKVPRRLQDNTHTHT